jgi:tRNA dimethylallyltransferase
MMEAGLLKEAESLFDFRHLTSLKTVGYRELFDYMEGKSTLPEAVELIKRNTRRYAKRQITWWRRYDDMIII